MPVKSRKPTGWIDPDDAPELTDEFFAKAAHMIGDRVVGEEEFAWEFKKRLGRPPAEVKRPTLNMRIDPDVLAARKASGR
ncbi:MAG: hypothetical protein GAK38_01807 [Xylophilus sp.]|nr:MAG: hypothetical protein GAK38_01807 [Xylophilus sp.]